MVYINGSEYECKVAHQQPSNSQILGVDHADSKIVDGILTYAQAHTGMVAGKVQLNFT